MSATSCSQWSRLGLSVSLIVNSVLTAVSCSICIHFFYFFLTNKKLQEAREEGLSKHMIRPFVIIWGISVFAVFASFAELGLAVGCISDSNALVDISNGIFYITYPMSAMLLLASIIYRAIASFEHTIHAFSKISKIIIGIAYCVIFGFSLSIPIVVIFFGNNSPLFIPMVSCMYGLYYTLYIIVFIMFARPLMQVVMTSIRTKQQQRRLQRPGKFKISFPKSLTTSSNPRTVSSVRSGGGGPLSSLSPDSESRPEFSKQEKELFKVVARFGIILGTILFCSIIAHLLLAIGNWSNVLDDIFIKSRVSSMIFTFYLLVSVICVQWTFRQWQRKTYQLFCQGLENKCVSLISQGTNRVLYGKPKKKKEKKYIAAPGAIEANRNEFVEQTMTSHYFLYFLGCNIDIPMMNRSQLPAQIVDFGINMDGITPHWNDNNSNNNNNNNNNNNSILALGVNNSNSNNYNNNNNVSNIELNINNPIPQLPQIVNDNDSNNNSEDEKEREKCNLKGQEGGKNKDNIKLFDSDEANDMMTKLVLTIIKLIEYKLPLSQDLLILSILYCDNCKNKELQNKLTGAIEKASSQCLNPPQSDTKFKVRHQQWFKQYLLRSNAWIMPKKDISRLNYTDYKLAGYVTDVQDQDSLWFDTITDTISKALSNQKEMILNSIKNEKEKHASGWNHIVTWKCDDKCVIELTKVRQDDEKIGIMPGYSALQLNQLTKKSLNYDSLEQYNSKNYLTQCLVIAHAVNDTFQRDAEKVFSEMKIDGLIFQNAPVKLENRWLITIIKANTDYADSEFPSIANVCDFVRCSVTVENSDDLLTVLDNFSLKIIEKKAGCIKGIARIKNGFSVANGWNLSPLNGSLEEFGYFDFKLNLVIEVSMDELLSKNKQHSKKRKYNYKRSKGEKIKMICELQVLLKSLLIAKKLGHFGYSVSRKGEYFKAVRDLVDKDDNLTPYISKLRKFARQNKFNQFCREMILKPNAITDSDIHNAFPAISTTNSKYSKMKEKYLKFRQAAQSHWKEIHQEFEE